MGRRIGLTRERLVSVAAQLADEYGFEHLTLAGVAKRLGIRIPSIYNHVDGLPGLRRELALLGGRQILEMVLHAVRGKSADDAVTAIASTLRYYAIDHPGLYAASVRAPAADDLEAQRLSGEIVGIIMDVFKSYRFDDIEAIHAVRGLRSVIHGYVMLEKAGGFGMPIDREESYQFLVESFLIGLNARCK